MVKSVEVLTLRTEVVITTADANLRAGHTSVHSRKNQICTVTRHTFIGLIAGGAVSNITGVAVAREQSQGEVGSVGFASATHVGSHAAEARIAGAVKGTSPIDLYYIASSTLGTHVGSIAHIAVIEHAIETLSIGC